MMKSSVPTETSNLLKRSKRHAGGHALQSTVSRIEYTGCPCFQADVHRVQFDDPPADFLQHVLWESRTREPGKPISVLPNPVVFTVIQDEPQESVGRIVQEFVRSPLQELDWNVVNARQGRRSIQLGVDGLGTTHLRFMQEFYYHPTSSFSSARKEAEYGSTAVDANSR